jgi:DNA-directed RNA polymerase subunit RPC12/RpoP
MICLICGKSFEREHWEKMVRCNVCRNSCEV